MRIRTILLAALTLALAAAFAADAAAAPRKPGRPIGTYEQRMKVCDQNNFSCDQTCDQLIDIDNNVAECRKQCDARYSRCQRWAKTSAMIVLPPDDTGGTKLNSACAKVGGVFDDGGGLLATCTNDNCDGDGGACFVVCPNQSACTGHTPSPLTGNQTLLSILQNGDKVFRQLDKTPAGSLMEGGDASPDTPPVIFLQ